MPKFDLYHFILPLLVFIPTVLFYQIQTIKFNKQLFQLESKNRDLSEYLTKIKTEMSAVESKCEKLTEAAKMRGPSIELSEFFKDIDVKGYALIRVDPDHVFYRGKR